MIKFSIKSISNIFNKKSVQSDIYTNNCSSNNAIFFLNDNLKKEVINARYTNYYTIVGSIITKISQTGASLPILIQNKKTTEILTNSTADLIYSYLEKPSYRNQSSFQLIQDLFHEFLLNGVAYLLYTIQDEAESIEVIRTDEITASVNDNKYITRIQIRKMLNNNYIFLDLNKETGYYEYIDVRNNKQYYLFTSDIMFEGGNFLSKSTLNTNYIDVYTCYTLINKNSLLTTNKDEKNIVVFSKPEGIITQSQQELLSEQINSKIESVVRNGSTSAIFSPEQLNSQLLKLNDGKFEGHYLDIFNEAYKRIYLSYCYPISKDLEQAKYDNAGYSQISYIEEAVIPKLNIVYNVLTQLMQFVTQDDSFILTYDKSKSVEYQAQNINILNKTQLGYTLNEYRHKIGLEPINDERGNQLMSDLNTNINNTI